MDPPGGIEPPSLDYETSASPLTLQGNERGPRRRSPRAVAGLLRRAPCESRTRVTGLEDRVLTVRTTVRRLEVESGVEPLRPEVAARRLPTWRLDREEEGGGIEPLGLSATTQVFGTRCRPLGGASSVAGRQRFERCSSALETDCSPRSTDPLGQGGRNRTCVDLVPGQVASH